MTPEIIHSIVITPKGKGPSPRVRFDVFPTEWSFQNFTIEHVRDVYANCVPDGWYIDGFSPQEIDEDEL